MAGGIITILGKEYVVATNGMFVDLDGKLAGFLAPATLKSGSRKRACGTASGADSWR